jgi:methionyl-tRNA synthetase
VRDAKMSKSVGNVLDPFRVIERYGLDALRYYLFRDVRFGADGDVSYQRVHDRFNQELANDLGNLVSRSVAMIGKYRAGRVPAGAVDAAIAAAITTAADRFVDHVDRFELTEALEAAWVPVRDLNRFVEDRAPWALAKDPDRASELDAVLYTLADGIRAIAVMLAAVMPDAAVRILAAVGADADLGWAGAAPGLLPADTPVVATGPLFPRVDEPLA